MIKRVLYIIVAAAVVVLDQLVKFRIAATIGLWEAYEFIPHVLALTHARNTGVSFSLFSDNKTIMTVINIITVAVCIAVLLYILRGKRLTAWLGWALAFIVGGAAGNAIDRIRLGYVVDMFLPRFVNFAIFNVADSFLTIGVVMLAIYVLGSGRKTDK